MAEFFDTFSFGLGAGAGVLTTLAVQRVNRIIRERREGQERAVVRTFATRQADDGYLRALVAQARKSHLFGEKVSLQDILIEPRFIPPPDLIELPEEDVPIENVFASLPLVHDYPHMHAPYNMKTLSVGDLSRGTRRIVMVGLPGSGRTTALYTIALWSSGFMEFPPKRDAILQELEDALDPKKDVPIPEQILRVRRRVAMGKLMQEKLMSDENKDSKPVDPTDPDEEVPLEAPSQFRRSAPIYIHLADIVLDSGEFGRQVDPAEPLVRGLQRQTGYVTSRRLVNKTYKLLENGNALVLVDGYDDIVSSDRPQAIRWMNALMELYPDNFFIFAMPPEGYGLLMESGAVPVFLRPWHKQDMHTSLDKVLASWSDLSKKAVEYPTADYETVEDYAQTLKNGGEGMLPLDHTLRTWSVLRGTEDEETTYMDRMQAYLEDLFPKAPDIMSELKRFATIQLDQGFITMQNLIDFAMEREKTGQDPILTRTVTSEVETVKAETITSELSPEDQKSRAARKKELEKIETKVGSEQGKLLDRMVKAGILRQFRGGRYQFRHKLLASYLAAIDLTDVEEYLVYRKYIKPDWEYAMNYLAGMRDVDFLVAEQLDNELDVRLEKILKLTKWLKYAGKEAVWRNNLLRYLGNMFATPNQFSVVRERVAAALVSSRDDGARVVFRRGLQTRNAEIRRLCCYALGALQDRGAVDALQQIVLQDNDLENKIAGQLGLIALGTEEALIAAVELMDLVSSEEPRRAVTESLAADNVLGYPTLRDMIESESISMRRAALYGVARVPAEWSWILIDRVFQQDTESFVRLASEVVMRQKFDQYFYRLEQYPDPTETDWFIEWAEIQRDYGKMAYDIEPEDALDMAFEQEDDLSIRWLLTGTIGQLGEYEMIDKLYKALQDNEEMIRDLAYRGLAQFQERLGKPIPIPLT